MLEKREFEKNEFLWRVFTALTVVSGFFSLIVFLLMVLNYLQVRMSDPVDNPLLTQLRIEYAELPEEDQVLAARIQELDLLNRKAYFTSQKHLRIGAILLFVGCSIFLISFKNMMRWRRERPKLAETPTHEREFLAYAESRNLISWAGVVLLGGGLAAAYFTESALYRTPTESTAVAASSEKDEQVAEAPARTFPAWDEVQKQWPTFRGPSANGVAHFASAPTDWDIESGRNVKWKVEVPLPGSNSPVIWGNRLFISGANEKDREVYCYDTDSGELEWMHRLEPFPNTPAEPVQVTEDTGHAAPTLAVHGEQVYAIFANGDLAAIDFEGNLIWGKNVGIPANHYGHSSSLVAYDNLVYVQLDHSAEAKLLALDAANGKEVWTAGREHISWASPTLVDTEFGLQLLLCDEAFVTSYDPKTGKKLWEQECLGGEVAPSPAYADGVVFVANEYAMGTAVKLSGSEGAIESEVLWEYDEVLPEVASPIGDGERFYLATSYGELAAIDAESGEELWLEEVGSGFYSSPVLVGDRIYIADMEGAMHIVKAAPEFEKIASVPLGEPAFATPAFMDNRIYIRTQNHLFCIEGGHDGST